MHKHILAAILRGDEAETLGVVEPLYCSRNHVAPLYLLNCDGLQFIQETFSAGVATGITGGLPKRRQEMYCNKIDRKSVV